MDYSLPVAVLLGLYLGALTGVVPALVAWCLGFVFRYVTGVSLPGFGVVVLGVAIAGVQGGLLGLLDPTVLNSPVVIVAVIVVMLVTQYAHAKGDSMGSSFPRRIGLRHLRENRLSSDVIERVGRFGQVRVRVTGTVGDIDGYPPLSDDLRSKIRDGEWTFPGDLPLVELESRLADRLRTEHDLADVSVEIDAGGKATVAAAPPEGSLSRRLPANRRAVSVDTLVPTGIARGDEVALSLDDCDVIATVLSAKTDDRESDDDGNETTDSVSRAPTTTGGDGRVTVAVSSADAKDLVRGNPSNLRVRSRETRSEFELVELFRQAGKHWRKLHLSAESELDGMTVGALAARDTHDVAVLGVERGNDWTVAPSGTTALAAGDELYVVGTRDSIRQFSAVVE
ncbi:TrkA-C domain-containing protein [Haladaptatus litoreus]|uniref:TrkA-C domain-containing protein n=1 Tax=Haladaptatus litoreus TaxID=553468 RepID=A0A1N7B7T8_9EURY|nr:TrkA C-terminal domain-containing protein [Haladaptatus litoreus]SIR47333.1 TrkA-C domain-containing protein [Haladaptatus litoreus]